MLVVLNASKCTTDLVLGIYEGVYIWRRVFDLDFQPEWA